MYIYLYNHNDKPFVHSMVCLWSDPGVEKVQGTPEQGLRRRKPFVLYLLPIIHTYE